MRSSRRHRLLAVVVLLGIFAALVGGFFAVDRYIVRPGIPFLLSRIGYPTSWHQLAELKSDVKNIRGVRSVDNLHEAPKDLWVGTVDGYADVILDDDLSVGQVSSAAKAIAAAMRRDQSDYARLHATLISGNVRVAIAPDDALNVQRIETAFTFAKDALLRGVAISWTVQGDAPNIDLDNSRLEVTVELNRASTVSLADTWTRLAPLTAKTLNGDLVVERDQSTTKRPGVLRVASGALTGLESVKFALDYVPPQAVLDWVSEIGADPRVLGYSLSGPRALVGVSGSGELRAILGEASDSLIGTKISITYYSPQSDEKPLSLL